MLNAVSQISSPDHLIDVFSSIGDLPVFSPDSENNPLPPPVQKFADMVGESDGLIVSSPEYIHAIPGGLKNAIDWLVSRDEIIGKPIVLMHASHRGDDMLTQLRLVLSTVSDQFRSEPFFRLDLLKLSPEEIAEKVTSLPNRMKVEEFLRKFADGCE
jgi:NAD(P)H-dependent FMN reductase